MIDRSHIERELEIVRQQGREAQAMVQQAANVAQQAIGAEKAFSLVLKLLDENAKELWNDFEVQEKAAAAAASAMEGEMPEGESK